MNYLVLSDELFPKTNANGICLKNIINEIEKQGHCVKYVSRVSDRKYISRDESAINFYYNQLLSWSSCNSLSKKIVYIFKRVFSYFEYPRINKELVGKYFSSAKIIIDSFDIDVIFCVCNPIETVEASVKLKEIYKDIKIVLYNLDTVSDIPFPRIEKPIANYLTQKAFKWEKRSFSVVDVIVNLKCHEIHFDKSLYKDYHHKMLFQDIPMLVKPSLSIKKIKSNTTKRLVYAGSFYRTLREPSILIDLLDNIPILNYRFSIYTSIAYCDIIRKMLNEATIIDVNEYLKSDELNKEVLNSDILVSLGNRESNMFPSKIVSYVAYGMPIIHIFQDDLDPVISYLKPYSNKLLLDNRESCETNRKKIVDYLDKNHSNTPWEEIFSEYRESTPEYCAKQIIAAIKEK